LPITDTDSERKSDSPRDGAVDAKTQKTGINHS